MNIQAWMKKEKSGLAFSTLELCEWTAKAGHTVSIRQPSEDEPIAGPKMQPDMHTIHSQLGLSAYYDEKPKFLWCHGEPLSSVGNGVSMKALTDLAPQMEAFICMRKDEYPIWRHLKKTYVVPKGIDLERFHPLDGVTERLAGEPAVLYYENWRGQRNPLYVMMAMAEVWKKLPKARLHLFNCGDKKMFDTFKALIDYCKFWPFVRSLSGPVQDVNLLLNRVDIVVSGLAPLYARSIEAFGAGKAFISPGYHEHDDYPFACQQEVHSIAAAIIKCWENYSQVNFRTWAEERHNIVTTIQQATGIYARYL